MWERACSRLPQHGLTGKTCRPHREQARSHKVPGSGPQVLAFRGRHDQRFHLGHSRLEAHEQRMRHQRMANVQLVNPLDGRDRFHVVVMQTVAGIDDQPLRQAKRYAIGDTLQFFGDFGRSLCIGITARVQLDRRGANAF